MENKRIFILAIVFFAILSTTASGQAKFGISAGFSLTEFEKTLNSYSNYIRFPVHVFFVEPRISFSEGSNYAPGDEYNWFHNSNTDYELAILINPIRKKNFNMYIGGGIGLSKQSQTLPVSFRYEFIDHVEHVTILHYNTFSAYVAGTTLNTNLEYAINSRFNIETLLVLKTYEHASSMGILFGLNYKFNN